MRRDHRASSVATCAVVFVLLAAVGFATRTAHSEPAVPAGAPSPRDAVVLDLDGPIGPAGSDYVARGLAKAADRGAALVVLRLDTPGGLDTSMREIVRAVLASPVPVAGFVAPSGARAASAGTYILYAAHIAAMAPGTNLGAATPVQIGASEGDGKRPGDAPDKADGAPPGMAEKAVNDAVAYIRSLAEMRGRNAAWAEDAVRRAASLSAEQALKLKVIDVIAPDTPALLRAIDGRSVTTSGGTVRLDTAAARVVAQPADWRTRLLALITDPNVAALLMLIGVYALIFEFYSPGLIGPGVVGAICILLALYAFHVLPVDYGGVALLLLGIALMVAEAFVGAFGVLAIGGLVAFVLGSIMLMQDDVPGFTVAWELIGSVALVLGGTFVALSTFVLRARRRPVVAGREQLPGSLGPVLTWERGEGRVRVHGEVWRARSPAALRAGQQVRVTGVDGLTLEVEPDEPAPGSARR
jgi:membrane-bound serine protease (ClpP class)